MENTLVIKPSQGNSGREMMTEEREEVYRVMYQLDRFFNLHDAGT
jgi:hypothetical protein